MQQLRDKWRHMVQTYFLFEYFFLMRESKFNIVYYILWFILFIYVHAFQTTKTWYYIKKNSSSSFFPIDYPVPTSRSPGKGVAFHWYFLFLNQVFKQWLIHHNRYWFRCTKYLLNFQAFTDIENPFSRFLFCQ
jgi:hypothetical protein